MAKYMILHMRLYHVKLPPPLSRERFGLYIQTLNVWPTELRVRISVTIWFPDPIDWYILLETRDIDLLYSLRNIRRIEGGDVVSIRIILVIRRDKAVFHLHHH